MVVVGVVRVAAEAGHTEAEAVSPMPFAMLAFPPLMNWNGD